MLAQPVCLLPTCTGNQFRPKGPREDLVGYLPESIASWIGALEQVNNSSQS